MLVTVFGGTGFLGRGIVERLTREGIGATRVSTSNHPAAERDVRAG